MENKTPILKEFYTLEQLSKEINIAIPSLRKFIKEGELKASKLGIKYVISREDVKKWLEENRVKTN